MRDAKQPGGKPVRILQLFQVLKRFQKDILSKVESIFPVPYQAQQVIVDALFPAGHQDVIGVHVTPARFGDQVAVLNLPKNQISAPLRMTPGSKKKTEVIK